MSLRSLLPLPRLAALALLLPLGACVIHADPGADFDPDPPAVEIEVEVVRLQHAVAHEMAAILSDSLAHLDWFRVVPDARTNSLVLRGSERVLAKAKDLLAQLDQAPSPR